MTTARCDHCHQDVHATPTGLACGCHQMAAEKITALLQAWEGIPEPWPVFDLLDLLEELKSHEDL